MKVYITKYALTLGIEELDVPEHEERAFSEDGYLSFVQDEPWRSHFYSRTEWHHTRADAVARAKAMRENKLKSIDKQRKRIAALTFE